MNRAGLIITLLMGCLALLLWKIVNVPDVEPPWPTKITGYSFSPYRGVKGPESGSFPTIEQIDRDLALLAGNAHAVRTYSVDGTLAEVPRLAAAHGLNITLGAWIQDDDAANEQQIRELIRIYRENHPTVVRVLVGNEAILRKDRTVSQMIGYLEQARKSIWAPVSLAEPWHIWLEHPELVEHVDFLAIHLLPYWEGIPVDDAVNYVVKRYEELQAAYPDKPIVITEVGWPSKGRIRQGAVPSTLNQAKFLRRFLNVAEANDYTYYVLEAFDQIWKRSNEGAAGSHWGIYDDQRRAKFAFTAPVIRVPQWRGLAAISITLAVLVLLLLFRDSGGLKARGSGFLAAVTFLIASFAVWIVYDFQQHYMTKTSLAVGILLMLAACGAIVVILAEAHEWAEALWTRNWRRLPKPSQGIVERDLPMVSIHVPTYNEPPEMLIQTLDALSTLNYPRFEVLVIDNNTEDPAVWEPVAGHCKSLGSRFRFYHVAPLDGYKAGALNYALDKTDRAADVVAVIDSDYQVEADWLRDLIPQFADPDIAVVQAPQDYRDGGESLFKAMCLAEYRGFFSIGMVTRNERNAIIQHGTMTMVRRRVLKEVGGWAEWCITEDAELGLRIFEQGHKATYIPQSYGKGLMPDTFLDYKKQRFRWAYGSVLILRHHLMAMLGLTRTKLTRGQRYHFLAGWLPWFADGVNLIFNLAAISWSCGMVLLPDLVAPPHILFAVLPISLFAFKSLKMFFLYRRRVTATRRQSLMAAIAGLALSHIIARAMMSGFVTSRIGFFRTPKQGRTSGLIKALGDAREELLFVIALGLAAVAVQLRYDGMMLDIRTWALVLTVQAIPYTAAVLMSLLSCMPRLPVRWCGSMHPLEHQ